MWHIRLGIPWNRQVIVVIISVNVRVSLVFYLASQPCNRWGREFRPVRFWFSTESVLVGWTHDSSTRVHAVTFGESFCAHKARLDFLSKIRGALRCSGVVQWPWWFHIPISSTVFHSDWKDLLPKGCLEWYAPFMRRNKERNLTQASQ